MTLLNRLTADGPKRILALDAGGIRGAITAGFLERIESILRERHQNPDLRLCDYFDLIGGTSTGAIIAGQLVLGKTAAEVKEFYLYQAAKAFEKKRQGWMFWKWVKLLEAKFDSGPLDQLLEDLYGDVRLGDQDVIKSGLCIVAKRVDTGSTWLLMNHPGGTYYNDNKSILLRHAVRASGAAPTYFVPELLEVGQGQIGAFVDGGVSMALNPALQLFLVATLNGFPFHWPTGEDNLLLVSVGTGIWSRREDPQVVAKGKLWSWAVQIPSMLMEDADWQNQLLLQYFSRSPTPWKIDSEVNDLASDLLTPEPIIRYLRYNAWLEDQPLRELGLPDMAQKVKSLRQMSTPENLVDLAKIGEAAAQQQVRSEHFPEAFNLA